MRIQKTVKEMTSGGLYLVATPIGNLDDITLRAVQTLQTVDYILAEDTRVSRKLLQHLNIDKPLISFHEHNQFEKAQEVILDIEQGKTIALISDAGMPCISDPGALLVIKLIESKLPVSVIPGVSASVALFSLSGMSEDGRFLFHGFLPTKEQAKRTVLSSYQDSDIPVIFYESPHRIVKTITLLPEIFNPETRICIGRELTKLHETLIWFKLSELAEVDVENLDTWKGEIAFLICPQVSEVSEMIDEAIINELKILIDQGMKPKVAMKTLSVKINKKPNELYEIWQRHKQE